MTSLWLCRPLAGTFARGCPEQAEAMMFRIFTEPLKPSRSESLAKAFSRLGWIGFWMQIALGIIPVGLMIRALMFGRGTGAGTRSGLPLVEYLTIAGLLIMVFTTLWSYRYTRLAKRIADPLRRPPESVVLRTAWTGVVASTLGIMVSMLVMVAEVTHLLDRKS